MKIHIRTSAALLAATLAAGATVAGAATPAAAATGTALTIKITQGSASVVSGTSVKLKGAYTCNDASGTHDVTIAIVAGQGNANGGHVSTLNVPCQVTNGAWAATVPIAGAKTGAEIDVEASIVDNNLRATADARLIAHTAFVSADPTVTDNADGTVTISGTYGCSDTETADVVGQLTQIAPGGAAALGVAAFTANCPATNAPWTAKVNLARIPLPANGSGEQSFALTWGDGHTRITSTGELPVPAAA